MSQSNVPSSPALSSPASGAGVGQMVPAGDGVASSEVTRVQAAQAQAVHIQSRRQEIREARSAGQRWRRISRWLGLAIFVTGAALLVLIFWDAYQELQHFQNPGYLNGEFNSVRDDSMGSIQSVVQSGFAVFGSALLHLLYLLVLGFLASALAARGIQFFAASEAVIDEAVVPDETV